MSVTPNNTLPSQWSEDIRYIYGDLVSYAGIIYKCIQSYPSSEWTPHNPATDVDREWWAPLDIYIKDKTVMPHGSYSGDESFWDRDNIYIDVNGYLYLNNENTGINVKGTDGHVSLDFNTLTPEQIEQLKGDRGEQGPIGPIGPAGPRGPEGYVTLTPEQIAILKGDQGKSAYQSWLDQGHTGSEADFIAWLQGGIITLDTELSLISSNGVTNAAITQAFQSYKTQVNQLVNLLAAKVQDLENRLKATYNGDNINFRFGVTSEGKYGYYLSETSTVVPFEGDKQEQLTSASAFRSDPQIFQDSIGYGNPLAGNTSIVSQLTSPSSLEGSVSNTQEDPNNIYGNNVTRMSLEEAFNAYIYIYKDGLMTGNGTVGFYSMEYNYIDNDTPTTLTSANQEDVEGIYFAPNTISNQGSRLYIEVEPVNQGDTIYYQIGSYSNTNSKLPDLVSTGKYRETYQNGDFNSQITIEYPISLNKGYYFASSQQGSYKITKIYLS